MLGNEVGKRKEEEKLGASESKKKCEWKIERKKGIYSIFEACYSVSDFTSPIDNVF